MSGNPGSLILGKTETDAKVASEIRTWLKQVTGEENYIMQSNLVDFWKETKDKCDTLQFKKEGSYFTATLWKIAAECNTANLSDVSAKWRNGKLPPWQDPSLRPK